MVDFFVSTTVEVSTCPRCKAVTLCSWSEGLRVRADLAELTTWGEVSAILDGRETFTLEADRWLGRDARLWLRDATRIRGGTLRGPVVAGHRCALPVPAAWAKPAVDLAQVEEVAVEVAGASQGDEPPF